MLNWLRHVLRERREASGASLADIVNAGAQVGKGTLSRFENGGYGWPDNLDAMVNAYATVTGLTEQELWADALRLWQDDTDGEAAATARRTTRAVQRRSR